jgi:hypothetical protein
MTSDSASRVTRSRRSLQRSALLSLVVLTGTAALRAQETPPAPPPEPLPPPTDVAPATPGRPDAAPATTEDTSPAPTASAEQATTQDVTPPPAAADGKPAGKVGPTRDRFEPTEKVRADFDVSFPVDI